MDGTLLTGPALYFLQRRGRKRELLRQVVGNLRGLGHSWEVVDRARLACRRCDSFVELRHLLRRPEDRVEGGLRKSGASRGPSNRDFLNLRRGVPECLPALVVAVHSL